LAHKTSLPGNCAAQLHDPDCSSENHQPPVHEMGYLLPYARTSFSRKHLDRKEDIASWQETLIKNNFYVPSS